MKTKTKDYPSRSSGSSCSTDKYLFIDGVKELLYVIDAAHRCIDSKIRLLKDEKCDLRMKKVNGGEYWYLWRDGAWKSKGRIELYHDYKEKLEQKIQDLEEKKEGREKKIKSIVVSRIGKHYITNSKRHLNKEHDVIPLKKLYPYIDQQLEDPADKFL